MGMPKIGCIAILSCPNSVACSSISQAVSGDVKPPKSLCALSVSAGKTAPHGMTEFYGYAPAPTQIYLSTVTTCTSAKLSYCSMRMCGISTAGNCVCICACLSAAAGDAKTTACSCIICNSVVIGGVVAAGGLNQCTLSFVADDNDSVIFCASACGLLGTSYAESCSFIITVTNIVGNYCLGTPFIASAFI